MWKPRHLTTLWAFTAWYRDRFTVFTFYLLDEKREETQTNCLSFTSPPTRNSAVFFIKQLSNNYSIYEEFSLMWCNAVLYVESQPPLRRNMSIEEWVKQETAWSSQQTKLYWRWRRHFPPDTSFLFQWNTRRYIAEDKILYYRRCEILNTIWLLLLSVIETL
jgi:hypothetical protein